MNKVEQSVNALFWALGRTMCGHCVTAQEICTYASNFWGSVSTVSNVLWESSLPLVRMIFHRIRADELRNQRDLATLAVVLSHGKDCSYEDRAHVKSWRKWASSIDSHVIDMPQWATLSIWLWPRAPKIMIYDVVAFRSIFQLPFSTTWLLYHQVYWKGLLYFFSMYSNLNTYRA